jgi:hypothetical protein
MDALVKFAPVRLLEWNPTAIKHRYVGKDDNDNDDNKSNN